MKKIAAIIPARFESTRFPGKPLVEIHGKSMIQRVYEQLEKVSVPIQIIVATDDQRILEHALDFKAEVILTSRDHKSGTDRVAEVARLLDDVDIVINVQGDEPFIHPNQILQLIELFENENVLIASLANPIRNLEELENNNVVKVMLDENSFARSFHRNIDDLKLFSEGRNIYKHQGIYGFQRETLLQVCKLPQSKAEKKYKLEQLRWMDNGYQIKMAISAYPSYSIDTPQDLERILNMPQLLNK